MTDATEAGREEPQGAAAVRVMAMPADTNAYGDIFGGWVMSQMDIGGAVAATECARGRVVTAAMDAMSFIRPVKVGDLVSVYARVVSVGRTSMRVETEAWVTRFADRRREKVTEATFTFVAMDEDGRPRPVDRSAAPGAV